MPLPSLAERIAGLALTVGAYVGLLAVVVWLLGTFALAVRDLARDAWDTWHE